MGTSSNNANQASLDLNVEGEIINYLQLCSNFNSDYDDVLDFWKRNRAKLPILFNLTRTILAIPISSADAERSFSVSGALLRAKRASMNPHRAHKALFVHDNVHVLEDQQLKQFFGTSSSEEK